jgi:hypothetical protein
LFANACWRLPFGHLKTDRQKGKIGKYNHENTKFWNHEIHSILLFVFLTFRDFVVNVLQLIGNRSLAFI